ncbi:hypothetical protein QBC33DRAFT_247854 [Phialemonium atrogriseum]|uniref:Uncharacterized protein n=1 Tax=Phialemonium atrogriseum TaxID=1093897 RepID=A0AAJ0FJK9_9PEZI|nr:uncharacterized protein QBC33DRAFT_247854 [Phialemonium atrogriseum]KAK1763215.1 hypothetical protein QBC33DRAFT_247854 [Phialemonium atrogriseum]
MAWHFCRCGCDCEEPIKTPFMKFHGSPHATDKTKDPWHASAAFRRKEDFKGSGVSLHVYPDGTVMPSKAEFPRYQATAATVEEVGKDNAKWLSPEFVAAWQAADEADAASSDKKGNGKAKAKAKAESSKGSSSKQHIFSGKHCPSAAASSSSSSSKGEATDHNKYTIDPNTGILYRYAENGVIVYLDPDTQLEYYYDEDGQAVWV